jgi:hypothetical protein
VFLTKPEAQDPEIRLRILTTRGMLEINYDASEAQANWKEVGSRALQLHHFQLATQAEGEQGIAAFLLGDTGTAKKRRFKAWGLSKSERDSAATVRYASPSAVSVEHGGVPEKQRSLPRVQYRS